MNSRADPRLSPLKTEQLALSHVFPRDLTSLCVQRYSFGILYSDQCRL